MLGSCGNKPPGKENRASKASNALTSLAGEVLYEMAGCLRSAVLLALRSKLIERLYLGDTRTF